MTWRHSFKYPKTSPSIRNLLSVVIFVTFFINTLVTALYTILFPKLKSRDRLPLAGTSTPNVTWRPNTVTSSDVNVNNVNVQNVNTATIRWKRHNNRKIIVKKIKYIISSSTWDYTLSHRCNCKAINLLFNKRHIGKCNKIICGKGWSSNPYHKYLDNKFSCKTIRCLFVIV